MLPRPRSRPKSNFPRKNGQPHWLVLSSSAMARPVSCGWRDKATTNGRRRREGGGPVPMLLSLVLAAVTDTLSFIMMRCCASLLSLLRSSQFYHFIARVFRWPWAFLSQSALQLLSSENDRTSLSLPCGLGVVVILFGCSILFVLLGHCNFSLFSQSCLSGQVANFPTYLTTWLAGPWPRVDVKSRSN